MADPKSATPAKVAPEVYDQIRVLLRAVLLIAYRDQTRFVL